MPPHIQRHTDLPFPLPRVWRPLSDHHEFGQWFGVQLDQPFSPAHPSTGHITHPGYEHLPWHATIQNLDPPRLLSFTWHPYAIDPHTDYSHEPPTLVEFRLEPTPTGTRLTLTESGFENLPPHRRDQAHQMNSAGWDQQLKNIHAHLAQHPL